MTLPLQPMSTAPRDGREVLVVLNAVYASWSDSNRILARWNASISEWDEGDGVSHEDSACIGWLDLAALVRDSDRLACLATLNGADVMRRVLGELRYPYGLDEFRAAIDKEMGRASAQTLDTVRRVTAALLADMEQE